MATVAQATSDSPSSHSFCHTPLCSSQRHRLVHSHTQQNHDTQHSLSSAYNIFASFLSLVPQPVGPCSDLTCPERFWLFSWQSCSFPPLFLLFSNNHYYLKFNVHLFVYYIPKSLEYNNVKRRRKVFVFNYTGFYNMQSYCVRRASLKLLFTNTCFLATHGGTHPES